MSKITLVLQLGRYRSVVKINPKNLMTRTKIPKFYSCKCVRFREPTSQHFPRATNPIRKSKNLKLLKSIGFRAGKRCTHYGKIKLREPTSQNITHASDPARNTKNYESL